jgi:hypothetical protein
MNHYSTLRNDLDSAVESIFTLGTLPDKTKKVLQTMSSEPGKRPIFLVVVDKSDQNKRSVQNTRPTAVIGECDTARDLRRIPFGYPNVIRENDK